MFKHVITVIILCASFLVGNSQLTRFEYGLHGGLNINSVSGTGISKDHRDAITGMNLGGHFKWNSSDHFGIKILLSYDENGYGYHNLDLATSSGTGIAKADILTKLKFVNFPILAEYSAGNRVRLNVDVGLFGGILLNTEHITKYKSNIPPGQEAIMRSSSNDRHILNYGLAVGFGVQVPIAQKITLDLDARNSTGLANVIRINGNNQKVETNCFAIIAGISFKI